MFDRPLQLEFVWRDGQTLRRELEDQTKLRIELTVTDNTSSIMTLKMHEGRRPAQLRLHRMFLAANPKVVHALSTWLIRNRSKRSAAILDEFIREHEHLIRSQRTRSLHLRTQGACFDLRALYCAVNQDYFDGAVDARITWGRVPRARRFRSIRLGSYTPEDHIIRIHPYLDQDFVPEFFVRYVLFHEMLHAHLGIGEAPCGRRSVHSAEFKRRERAYPDYDRAIAWHDTPKHLGRLLRPPKRRAV